MRLPNTVRALLSILGIPATEEGLFSAVSPFMKSLPTPVAVTATPGEPPTYEVTCATPHIRIATGVMGAPVVINLPNPADCPFGHMFSIDLFQASGGSGYAVIQDGAVSILIFPGIRYQFISANGNSLSMLNDWRLWGGMISHLTVLLGSPSNEFGTDNSVWATVNNLLERVETLEGGP